MLHAIQRNAALLLGLILSGFLCVLAAPALVSARGAIGPTVLQAQSPFSAILWTVLCFGGATIVAILVSRVLNTAVGLFVLGAGLFALAGRTETVGELAFASTGGRGTMLMVAVETLLWAGLTLLATLAMFALGGPVSDIHPDEMDRTPHPIISREAMKSAAAGALCLPVVWFIAQSPMKGQMIGAVFWGSVLAGLAGRLISPHVQPILLFVSPIVFGAIGHVVGMILLKRPLDEAYIAGTLPNLCLPMPIDYAAGSLAGVAVGVGWAKSFLQHDEKSSEN